MSWWLKSLTPSSNKLLICQTLSLANSTRVSSQTPLPTFLKTSFHLKYFHFSNILGNDSLGIPAAL